MAVIPSLYFSAYLIYGVSFFRFLLRAVPKERFFPFPTVLSTVTVYCVCFFGASRNSEMSSSLFPDAVDFRFRYAVIRFPTSLDMRVHIPAHRRLGALTVLHDQLKSLHSLSIYAHICKWPGAASQSSEKLS